MQQVKIIEFTVQTQADFQIPVPIEEAQLKEIAKNICKPPVASFVDPVDISLNEEDGLFGYDLLIPFTGGLGEVEINAKSVLTSFKQGRAEAHLKFIAESLTSIFKISVRHPVKRCSTTVTAHAIFDSVENYKSYMDQYSRGDSKILSGGVILASALPDWGGEVRFGIERSVGYENGLFVTCTGTTTKEISQDFFKALAERFTEIAKFHGLEFAFAQ